MMTTKKKFTPIKLEDLGLKPGEEKLLVGGAQQFLPPAEDPLDEERFSRIDPDVQSLTS